MCSPAFRDLGESLGETSYHRLLDIGDAVASKVLEVDPELVTNSSASPEAVKLLFRDPVSYAMFEEIGPSRLPSKAEVQ